KKMGDVMGALPGRRGVIQGMEDLPGSKAIKAEVPLNQMFGYSTQLRSLTQGRATYTMEFKHYAEAPKSIADSIINKDDKPKKKNYGRRSVQTWPRANLSAQSRT